MTAALVRVTDTDRHVLNRLIDGRTVQQVARELRVKDSAVAMRLLRLRDRFNAETNVQLVATVIRQGEV